jgi:hypothetical protein
MKDVIEMPYTDTNYGIFVSCALESALAYLKSESTGKIITKIVKLII